MAVDRQDGQRVNRWSRLYQPSLVLWPPIAMFIMPPVSGGPTGSLVGVIEQLLD